MENQIRVPFQENSKLLNKVSLRFEVFDKHMLYIEFMKGRCILKTECSPEQLFRNSGTLSL